MKKLEETGAVTHYRDQYYTMYTLRREVFSARSLDVIGAPSDEADAQALFEEAQEKYPNCDVEVHMGGQPLYYYLIAVQ